MQNCKTTAGVAGEQASRTARPQDCSSHGSLEVGYRGGSLCSLGASTLAMRHGMPASGCTLVGVDNSDAMIERCEHYIALDDHPQPVVLRCEDILDTPLTDASVTTLNTSIIGMMVV